MQISGQTTCFLVILHLHDPENVDAAMPLLKRLVGDREITYNQIVKELRSLDETLSSLFIDYFVEFKDIHNLHDLYQQIQNSVVDEPELSDNVDVVLPTFHTHAPLGMVCDRAVLEFDNMSFHEVVIYFQQLLAFTLGSNSKSTTLTRRYGWEFWNA